MKAPKKNPCGSCPYRCDSPSGLWAAFEYEKLPNYDLETHEQPPGVFMCHQQDDTICSGWAGTHDMQNNLALRIAAAMKRISIDALDKTLDYVSGVPLFATGQEAADHGMADIKNPGTRARKHADKFLRKEGITLERRPGRDRGVL